LLNTLNEPRVINEFEMTADPGLTLPRDVRAILDIMLAATKQH